MMDENSMIYKITDSFFTFTGHLLGYHDEGHAFIILQNLLPNISIIPIQNEKTFGEVKECDMPSHMDSQEWRQNLNSACLTSKSYPVKTELKGGRRNSARQLAKSPFHVISGVINSVQQSTCENVHMAFCTRQKKLVRTVLMNKLNIKKTKIMASDPIASWQIEGKG